MPQGSGFTPFNSGKKQPPPTATPIATPVGGSGFTPFGAATPSPSPTPNSGMTYQEPEKVEGTWGVVVSTLSPIIDVLSRGQYASAKFADSIADESKGILDALSEAAYEGIFAKEKLSYSDVIKRRAPKWAEENPVATNILGFIADVAFDPTTYLGIGLGKNGVKVGGRILTDLGKEAVETGIKSASRKAFIGKTGTIDIVETLGKELARPTKDVASGIKGGPRLHRIAPLANELEQQGYFDAVKAKTDEVNNLIINVTGKSDIALAKTIGKEETLKDLKKLGTSRIPNELTESEVFERVGQRIQRIADLNPQQQQLFETPYRGLYLNVGLPFGKQKEVAKILGTEKLGDSIKALNSYMLSAGKFGQALGKFEETIAGTFNRNYGLPEEYVKLRDELENMLGSTTDETILTTRKLFKNVDKEGRERIGNAMHFIDDETRKLEDKLQRVVTQDEASSLTQRGMKEFNLNDTEKTIIGLMHQDYANAALLEMRAGLLKNNLINYSPRGYEVIVDPKEMTLITRGKYGSSVPQPYLASSNARKFLTKAEAEAAGLVPELDAAILYSNRMLSSKRALSIKQFKDSVDGLFGTYLPNPKYGHTGILPTGVTTPSTIPKRVVDDMRMIGESVMPSGLNESTKNLLGVFDTLQSIFKRSATVLKPAFATRQLLSNTFQSAMISGIKAFKALDPRVAADASLLLFDRGKETKNLPEFVNKFISKFFAGNEGTDAILAQRTILSHITGEERLLDYAQDFKLRTTFGQDYSGTELIDLARKHGIIRGFDSTGEAFARKLQKELDFNEGSLKNVAGELGRYWKHASMVEDYGRMMLFLNGMRLGYSADDASKVVNKALFDYSRGLSSVEKSFIKRIVPFYSFQRFAIPYVLSRTMEQPGTAATSEKFVKLLEKLLVNGESLNPAEQQIFGDSYLVEQPRLFSGFDKDGKANFNILNNLTPLDSLSLLVHDRQGNIDLKRTTEKTILGAMTPFIKVPVEQLIDRNFFTGKTIDQMSSVGNLALLPDPVKTLLGMEDRTNMATGKTKTYISPFLGYAMMNLFPFLRDYVKPLDGVTSPMEGVLNIIETPFKEAGTFGVKNVKLDLAEQSKYSDLQTRKEVRELVKSLRTDKIRGADSQFEKDQGSLQELLQAFSENKKLKDSYKIRGAENKQQIPEGEEQTVPSNMPVINQPFK